MRMKKIGTLVLLSTLVLAAVSCGKEDPTPITPQKPEEKPVTPDPPAQKVVDYDKYSLRDVAAKAGLKLGVSFTYWEYRNNAKVADILKRDFAAVTFGNEMKHDGIVQADGAYNFTNAEAMAGWAKACGTELFGHTLGWHSQQQRAYLNNLISKAATDNNASLLQRNWNFEAGTLDGFTAEGFEISSLPVTASRCRRASRANGTSTAFPLRWNPWAISRSESPRRRMSSSTISASSGKGKAAGAARSLLPRASTLRTSLRVAPASSPPPVFSCR